jgi:hypothetical protein
MIGRPGLIIAAALLPAVVLAADRPAPSNRIVSPHSERLAGPYPWTWRAAKIRRADRCWRACLAEGGRDFQACLRHQTLTTCVDWNSGANLHCLHSCRLSGGPLLRMAE